LQCSTHETWRRRRGVALGELFDSYKSLSISYVENEDVSRLVSSAG
jgi:hypothetical protein